MAKLITIIIVVGTITIMGSMALSSAIVTIDNHNSNTATQIEMIFAK